MKTFTAFTREDFDKRYRAALNLGFTHHQMCSNILENERQNLYFVRWHFEGRMLPGSSSHRYARRSVRQLVDAIRQIAVSKGILLTLEEPEREA